MNERENAREFFTLVDEDGSEIEFEKIGEVTLGENTYFAMIPADSAEKAEADIAAPLWKEYQRLSNRLDYLAGDSDEFKELTPKCDAVKAEYDIHHAKVNELHRIYNDEVKRCSAALSFTLEDLSVLFFYMQRISQSIIVTITKPQGE